MINKPDLYFRAVIAEENGVKKMKTTTPTLLQRIIDSFKVGAKILIRVEEEKTVRSLRQNRFYWHYLQVIAEETGNLSDDLHEYFKRKFLPPRYIKVLNDEIKIPASTTGLSKAEFIEYMDKICALTNVPIPDPSLLSDYIPSKEYNIKI
jgi:hypothetical protein